MTNAQPVELNYYFRDPLSLLRKHSPELSKIEPMKLTDIDSLSAQLLQVMVRLSLAQQQVLDFALSLGQKELVQQWDDISDEEAAALKAEFEQEDLVMAEASTADYLTLLRQEDEA